MPSDDAHSAGLRSRTTQTPSKAATHMKAATTMLARSLYSMSSRGLWKAREREVLDAALRPRSLARKTGENRQMRATFERCARGGTAIYETSGPPMFADS